jgi:hypothetical protein
MEWLIPINDESSLVLHFTVLGSFASLLGSFGSLLILQPSRTKKLLLAMLLLVGFAELSLVGLGINARRERAARVEKKKSAAPRVEPTPIPQPTITEVKPEQTEQQAIAEGIAFNISSRSDASIRKQYCVDSDLSGTVYVYGGKLMVKLGAVDFDLCKYSSDNERQIVYKIGIGSRDQIAQKKWGALSWSQPQKGVVSATGSSLMTPEKSLVIRPKRQGKNKSAIDLSSYGVVASVYNPDRRGLYYFSELTGQ